MKEIYDTFLNLLNSDIDLSNTKSLEQSISSLIYSLLDYMGLNNDILIIYIHEDEENKLCHKPCFCLTDNILYISIDNIAKIKDMEQQKKSYNITNLGVYIITNLIHELEIKKKIEKQDEDNFQFDTLVSILDIISFNIVHKVPLRDTEYELYAYNMEYEDSFNYYKSIAYKLYFIFTCSDYKLIQNRKVLNDFIKFYNPIPFSFFNNKFDIYDEVWKYVCANKLISACTRRYPIIKVIYHDDGSKRSNYELLDNYFNSNEDSQIEYIKLFCFTLIPAINYKEFLNYEKSLIPLFERIKEQLLEYKKQVEESKILLDNMMFDKEVQDLILYNFNETIVGINIKFVKMLDYINMIIEKVDSYLNSYHNRKEKILK